MHLFILAPRISALATLHDTDSGGNGNDGWHDRDGVGRLNSDATAMTTTSMESVTATATAMVAIAGMMGTAMEGAIATQRRQR